MQPIHDCADALPGLSTPTDGERRCQPDRRDAPTSVWAALWPSGHRQQNRRAPERERPHFVDRFSSVTFVLILMLLAASIVDAVLTIHLLREGADEVNPLMGSLLEHGIQPFLIIKYALTAAGLPLLLMFQHHRLFGTRVRVRHLIPLAVALYAILITYQLVLVHQYTALEGVLP